MKRVLVALVFGVCLTPWTPAHAQAFGFGPDVAGRRPVRIIQTIPPVFPPRLQNTAVLTGDARIVIAIDHTGQLADWLVIGYTRREFADEALGAIKQWQFEPLQLRGEARSAQVEITIHFERSGVVVSLDPTNYMETWFEGKLDPGTFRPCTLREIDRIPTPIVIVSPTYDAALARRDVRGQTVVGFFIDETGTVRMPAVISADHEDLGVLAVEALRQWKFEPATRNNRAVLVRAQQTFEFNP